MPARLMTDTLVFEAQGMLTNSLRHTVAVSWPAGVLEADITCLESGGSDAWYDLLDEMPPEIHRCRDARRQLEFLQDVLLSMADDLKVKVVGIRHDPHGLLDFLLERETPPQTLDVVIGGIHYQLQHVEP